MIGGGPQKITVEIGGKIAASLGKALRESQRQVSTFGRNVNRSMNDAAIAGKKGFKGIFDNALWQQATIGATVFAGAIGLSVREAMKFDSAMADIRKAVDFSDGEKGVKRFGSQLIKLSTVLPYTAEQLTKIAAAAGFAGIAEKDIIPFTKSAAAMGVAFQMTAEDAGEAMVAMRASMGLTQPEVQQLGDAINYLSDKFQGTVNAADLVEVTRRIGAIGKASGLAKEEIAGLGAAFLASGTPVEVAGTGLKNFLNALTKGQNASLAQAGALASIFGEEGLAETIKRGRGKAKLAARGVAVDIAEELAKGMQVDAEGTIKSVIERMSKLPKDQQVSVAGALFGEESKAAIMPLLTNTKLLAQAFDLIADKTAFAGSMQKEFKNQMGTSAAQAKIFQNGVQAVGISVGTALLPSLNSILKTVTPLLIGFGEWAQKNEGLVTTIVLIGGALSGLVIALPIIAGVIGAIGTIGTAIGAVTAAFPVLAGIGTVIAVAGGPITLIIAGVVLLGIAIHSLIKNWGAVSSTISNVFSQALGVIRAWGSKVLGVMRAIPTMIISMFTGSNLGQRIMTSIIDGLKAKAGALFGWIRNTWSNITGFFGGGAAPAPAGGAAPAAAAASASRNAAGGGRRPPGRALGGPVTAGMPYIVGEKRRELFVPGMDGAIIPRIAKPAAAPKAPQVTAPAAAPKTPPININAPVARQAPTPAPITINAPVARQAPTPAPITINAPVTINATGDGAGIRDQVRAAFEDLMAMASSGYRVALND